MKFTKILLPIVSSAIVAIPPLTMATGCSKKSLDSYTWEEIKEISKSGEAAKYFKVGDTKKVQLKTQDINDNGKIDKGEVYQTVRIIGFDHDWSVQNKTIGITFEFANEISDHVGRSIATYYNEWGNKPATDADEKNFKDALNYANSSLRRALVGDKTESKQKISWYGYYGTEGDTTGINKHFIAPGEICSNTSVKDMLPDDLKGAITPAAKLYNYYDSTDAQKGKLVFGTSYVIDELFVLTPNEVGFAKTEQEPFCPTYEYYNGHTAEKDSIRNKQQLNKEAGHDNILPVVDGNRAESYSTAGCNINGNICWLRTPNNFTDYARAFAIDNDSGLISAYGAHRIACSVAPAFCV